MRDSTAKTVARLSRRTVLLSATLAGCANKAPPPVHVAGSDEIRIGVVGCGMRGRGAASQALESAPNVRITALADLFPDAIERTLQIWADRPKSQYDIPRERCFVGWDAYREILATDVNYVVLAAPPGFRPMHLKAAIDAGKHVYAEKAIAVDPAGVRTVLAAAETARAKKMGIVVGTWRRHDAAYIETVQRIHDGEIGRVIGGNVYFMQGGLDAVLRKGGWSDVEWQVRNFPYFTWLSGDFIVEHHVHQHDTANWVLGGLPRLCISMGGRQARTGELFGNIYDHFASDFEYPDGVHIASICRQMPGTAGRMGEVFFGTKGWADPSGKIQVDGKTLWKRKGREGNAWVQMHTDLINSVRAGSPINEAKEAADSHLTSIMARMSAYTGQLVRWSDAAKSPLNLTPPQLAFGPMAVAEVAIPGHDKLQLAH